MRDGSLRFSRVLAAVIVGVLLSSTAPALFLGEPVVENAAAAPGYYVKVGFLQDFQNWNPLNIEFVSDYVAYVLMFSMLFQYTEDWTGPVGDLATSWWQEAHPAGNMTLHVNLTQNAYFRNIVDLDSTANQLTAEDVAFTINLILANEGGAWDLYLEDVTGANATSTFSVAIDVAFQKATILDNLVWIPIVPKYMWESEPNPLGAKKPEWLVGSGPFAYNSSLKTQWYRFTRAPATNYHGSLDYPVGDPRGDRVIDPGIEGILYRYYSDDTLMVAAMNNGELDAIDLSGSPNLYLNELSPSITKMVTKEMGIIDIAVNGIPMDFRSTKQGGYAQGNPILLDPIVRKAIHMTLNKDFIANSLMQGLTTTAHPVLSPGYWQADILNKVTYGPAAAKALLLANGYVEGAGGYLFTTASSYPVQQGWVASGTRLEFDVHAPDTDPSYETIGLNWVGWAAQAGIMFNYETKSEAIMTNNEWYKANYDIWVWSWYWGPEPLSNLAVWTTDQLKPGGDNCQGPMGPWWYSAANSSTGKAYSAYDENFSAAEREFDEAARKVLVDRLQQFVYDSYAEMPPIYPAGLYAVSTQRVTGWGNWTEHLGRSISSDLPWVWFDLVPKGGNQMPEFDLGLDPSYQFVVNETQTFMVSIHDPDNDEINITWNFGDGSSITNHSAAGTTSSPVTFKQTHVYSTLALPPTGLSMNVTVSDGNPGGNATSYATIYVFPYPDAVPELTSPILSDPIDRAYVNDDVVWTASARDVETGGGSGSGLEFTWDWGDGTTTSTVYQPDTKGGSVTDTQTHNWTVPGPYDVTLYVWDGSLWPGHNVSMGAIPFMVVLNEPPTGPDISTITGNRNIWIDCIATATDIDGDPLQFTWNFSDGATNTYNVSYFSSTVPGEMVYSTAMHMWAGAGSYLVQVSVDDMTGMPGHNVTASVTAVISNNGVQVPPSSLALMPTPQLSYPDEVVTFVASAVDTNSDPLTMYLEFGDGSSATNTSTGGTTQRQYTTFTHAYAAAGVFSTTLWVDDGTGNNVSLWLNVTVKENEAPWLILPTYATAYFNMSFTLTPSRARDNDSDPLVLWYDWGDDTWSSSEVSPYNGTHVYEVAGDVEIIVWADDQTGLPGHNISKNVTITVIENFKPTFEDEILKDPVKAQYKEGDTVMFIIAVKDYEGDMVNITVDFGDGDVEKIPAFRPDPNNVTVKYINHTFEKGRDTAYTVTATVDDGQEMYRSDKSWNTRSTTVLVEKEAGSSALLIGAVIAIIAIVAVLLVFFLMKRKKGEKEETGGMEGMKPPVEPTPPPPDQ